MTWGKNINITKTKQLFFLNLFLVIYSCSRTDSIIEPKSESLTIEVDAKGNNSKLLDNNAPKDYLSRDTLSSLIIIREDFEVKYMNSSLVEENKLVFQFDEGKKWFRERIISNLQHEKIYLLHMRMEELSIQKCLFSAARVSKYSKP